MSSRTVPISKVVCFWLGLVLSDFHCEVGKVGWRMRDFTPKYHPDLTPSAKLPKKHRYIDLMCMEFLGLFVKII